MKCSFSSLPSFWSIKLSFSIYLISSLLLWFFVLRTFSAPLSSTEWICKKKQQPDPIFICMLPLSFLMVMFGPYQMLFVPRFLLCSFCKFFYCSPYEFNQTKKEIDCMIMHNMWIDGTAHRRHSVWQTSFFYPIFPRQYTFRQRVNICHRARLLDIYIFFCFDLMYGYCDDVTHYLDICDS